MTLLSQSSLGRGHLHCFEECSAASVQNMTHFDIKEFQILSEGNLLRLISHISPASAYLSHSRHSLKKPSPSLTLPTNRSMRSQSAKRVPWAGCITGSSPCSSQPPLSSATNRCQKHREGDCCTLSLTPCGYSCTPGVHRTHTTWTLMFAWYFEIIIFMKKRVKSLDCDG